MRGILLRKVKEQDVCLKKQPPRQHWVIIRMIHPMLTRSRGYYKIHVNKVWCWTDHKDKATTFPSLKEAEMCAVGSDLNRYTAYKIERL
jgi:hypothetical protein